VRCSTGKARPERGDAIARRGTPASQMPICTRSWCWAIGARWNGKTRLKANPAIARQRGGVQNWEPLLYVCHNISAEGLARARRRGLVRIARETTTDGLEPQTPKYDWKTGTRRLPRTSALGSTDCYGGSLSLQSCCSRAGANPTDGGFPRTLRRASGKCLRPLELL